MDQTESNRLLVRVVDMTKTVDRYIEMRTTPRRGDQIELDDGTEVDVVRVKHHQPSQPSSSIFSSFNPMNVDITTIVSINYESD